MNYEGLQAIKWPRKYCLQFMFLLCFVIW
jgi:hypothetical protein